ncbi:MAG: hypothetical protein WCK27_33015, partial [Verrucomicrobiota bacterium]
VRAILNPNGVVSPLRQRATTPLGLADTTRFSQGSSRLATLGFGAESLWDSPPERPMVLQSQSVLQPRPMGLQSQRDCVLQPRVAESARLLG